VGGRVYGEEDSRRGARAWRCGQPMKPEEVDSRSGRRAVSLFMRGATALAILEACQNLALTVHVAIQSEDPDSSEVCKTSTGRERCDATSQRLQDYNTTHLSQRASNRWGSRIEVLNRYELLPPSRLYQPLCHRAMRAAPVM
jgi:hypothetical protein